MGQRGPSAKPTGLKVLEGNPGKRALNECEPVPTGEAKCPDFLSLNARAKWSSVVDSMPPGIYTAADEGLLAAYCEAWALWKKATIFAQRVQGDEVSPWIAVMNKQAEVMTRISSKLGLSPGDRTNIKAPQKAEKSKFAGLIR